MCVFCEKIQDGSQIIAENDLAAAFLDGYPVTPGHVLIVPKRHAASWFHLDSDEQAAIFEIAQLLQSQRGSEVDGWNIGINVGAAAGQTVWHCHVHLIPRMIGDMDDPRGGVRGVIPEKQKY